MLRSSTPFCFLFPLVALAACESKPEQKLEASVQVVESERRYGFLEIVVTTLKGAYVALDPAFELPAGVSKTDLAGKATHEGITFYLPLAALPMGASEATLRVVHHELEGQEVKLPVKLARAPRWAATASMPGETPQLACDGVKCLVREGFTEHLTIEVEAPEGTKVTIGGAHGTVGTSRLVLEPDISGALVGLPMGDIDSNDDTRTLPLPLELALPDGNTLKRDLPLGTQSLRRRAFALLGKASAGPLELAGDSDSAKAKRDTLVFFSVRGGTATLDGFFGDSSTKVAEVDLVAIRRETGKRERSCGTYVGDNGEKGTFGVTMFDQEVAVYDRRTGKKLGARDFPAPPGECATVIDKKASGSTQTSQVEWKVLRDYAKTYLQ